MDPVKKTAIEFTDEELKTLNDVLRSTKVTFSSEEALLIKLGRAASPVLDLTHKVAIIFEQRAKEVMEAEQAAAVPTLDIS